jgi:hypothetical protein
VEAGLQDLSPLRVIARYEAIQAKSYLKGGRVTTFFGDNSNICLKISSIKEEFLFLK